MTSQTKITQDLANFYTAEAEKFYNTRKKNIRPEFEHILYEINSIPKDDIYILELGCGDGRFYDFLSKFCTKKFHYIWADVSDWLIWLAIKHYPEVDGLVDWQVADMLEFTSRTEFEQKFDIVVSIAAVQHIYTQTNRVRLFDNIYNICNYEAKFIMTNWSLSYWFIDKYKKVLRNSFVSKILSKHDICDLYIPRKSMQWEEYSRYYHMFLPSELRNICIKTNWIINKLWYIDNRWNLVQDWRQSRNTLLVASKNVIK